MKKWIRDHGQPYRRRSGAGLGQGSTEAFKPSLSEKDKKRDRRPRKKENAAGAT
jgi:hypothetical protein